MSIEDRVRAATEATAATVREIRPLTLPGDPAPAPPADTMAPPGAEPNRAGQQHRWSGWLVPLAAAAAVIAVAATLVAVRGTSGTRSALRSTSAASATSSAGTSGGIPPYYVTLNGVPGVPTEAVLGDTSTGKALATFKPPTNGGWAGIATSANDNTFVLYGYTGSSTTHQSAVFYTLRVPSGDPRRARLTRLTLAGSYAIGASAVDVPGGHVVMGVAVSPDGRTVAVFSEVITQLNSSSPRNASTLRTYSLATGQVLRTWTESGTGLGGIAPNSLSWLADGRRLTWSSLSGASASTSAVRDFQTLDTTSPGTSLRADSQTVFHTPDNDLSCEAALLTSDGKSVICGSGADHPKTCSTGALELISYSIATNVRHVLFRMQNHPCQIGSAVPMWAPSGSYVIGLVQGSDFSTPKAHAKVTTDLGVMTPTKFTPLPITQTGATDSTGSVVAF